MSNVAIIMITPIMITISNRTISGPKFLVNKIYESMIFRLLLITMVTKRCMNPWRGRAYTGQTMLDPHWIHLNVASMVQDVLHLVSHIIIYLKHRLIITGLSSLAVNGQLCNDLFDTTENYDMLFMFQIWPHDLRSN